MKNESLGRFLLNRFFQIECNCEESIGWISKRIVGIRESNY